ncbi:hypothetical protein C8R43DRAFT_957114 [Mycena crocata]|nr:hypothetical protein C8R43DRAFT_957114 [Mycena crocata]
MTLRHTIRILAAAHDVTLHSTSNYALCSTPSSVLLRVLLAIATTILEVFIIAHFVAAERYVVPAKNRSVPVLWCDSSPPHHPIAHDENGRNRKRHRLWQASGGGIACEAEKEMMMMLPLPRRGRCTHSTTRKFTLAVGVLGSSAMRREVVLVPRWSEVLCACSHLLGARVPCGVEPSQLGSTEHEFGGRRCLERAAQRRTWRVEFRPNKWNKKGGDSPRKVPLRRLSLTAPARHKWLTSFQRLANVDKPSPSVDILCRDSTDLLWAMVQCRISFGVVLHGFAGQWYTQHLSAPKLVLARSVDSNQVADFQFKRFRLKLYRQLIFALSTLLLDVWRYEMRYLRYKLLRYRYVVETLATDATIATGATSTSVALRSLGNSSPNPNWIPKINMHIQHPRHRRRVTTRDRDGDVQCFKIHSSRILEYEGGRNFDSIFGVLASGGYTTTSFNASLSSFQCMGLTPATCSMRPIEVRTTALFGSLVNTLCLGTILSAKILRADSHAVFAVGDLIILLIHRLQNSNHAGQEYSEIKFLAMTSELSESGEGLQNISTLELHNFFGHPVQIRYLRHGHIRLIFLSLSFEDRNPEYKLAVELQTPWKHAILSSSCEIRGNLNQGESRLKENAPEGRSETGARSQELTREGGKQAWHLKEGLQCTMHRASTRNCGGRRFSWNETVRMAVAMEVEPVTGFMNLN